MKEKLQKWWKIRYDIGFGTVCVLYLCIMIPGVLFFDVSPDTGWNVVCALGLSVLGIIKLMELYVNHKPK